MYMHLCLQHFHLIHCFYFKSIQFHEGLHILTYYQILHPEIFHTKRALRQLFRNLLSDMVLQFLHQFVHLHLQHFSKHLHTLKDKQKIDQNQILILQRNYLTWYFLFHNRTKYSYHYIFEVQLYPNLWEQNLQLYYHFHINTLHKAFRINKHSIQLLSSYYKVLLKRFLRYRLVD